MIKETVEKYFNNEATPEQTAKVLEWFETYEGQQYLHERLNVDADLMDRSELAELVPELDSEMLYETIQVKINDKRFFNHWSADWKGYAFKAAAAILVVITTSLFHVTHEQHKAEQLAKLESESIIFTTKDDQHREIRLSDGTMVRLNSNSEIVVSNDFMIGTREISLSGEAFFDVAHNPDRPFIIHANQSTVEVLGTSFNIRSYSEDSNVQVAVVDGKVSLKRKEYDSYLEQLSVVLSKNQYGFLDIEGRSIVVDNLAVDNYLAWKSGHFSFKDLTLTSVCTQLTRLYNVDCYFDRQEISELTLTASFSKGTLEKVLSVIALTLEIDFDFHEDRVIWAKDSR